MSFVGVTGPWASWWLANRNGGLPTGTFGSALVSDLAVGDYIIGVRSKVATVGGVTSGMQSFTLSRVGYSNYPVSWRTGDTVHIIRP